MQLFAVPMDALAVAVFERLYPLGAEVTGDTGVEDGEVKIVPLANLVNGVDADNISLMCVYRARSAHFRVLLGQISMFAK